MCTSYLKLIAEVDYHSRFGNLADALIMRTMWIPKGVMERNAPGKEKNINK